METILITGGTGLIGTSLTLLLQQAGYKIMYLSRKKTINTNVEVFHWDVPNHRIDHNAIKAADHIIHLAGVNVSEHRWTKSYKKEIVNSRVNSAQLLLDTLKKIPNQVKTVISASAIGYYGDNGDRWLYEDAPPAPDFWGDTCVQWEQSISQMAALNKRVVMVRTGIVLSGKDGALPRLISPVRWGVAPLFGTGKQFYSWIHIQDLCRMYLFAIENKDLRGPYNGVSPQPERFSVLMQTIARVIHRKKINVPVPIPLLKLVMGEFVDTLAFSMRCSSEKLMQTGFQFQFPNLENALHDLLKK